MLLDKQNMFSEAQAITGTAASTNVIDNGVAAVDVGPGTPLEVLVQVMETFTLLTSLTVALQTDDAENFGSAVTLQSMVVAAAALVAGAQLPFSVLPKGCKRYLRLNYTVTGTAPDAGKITAGLVWTRQTNNV